MKENPYSLSTTAFLLRYGRRWYEKNRIKVFAGEYKGFPIRTQADKESIDSILEKIDTLLLTKRLAGIYAKEINDTSFDEGMNMLNVAISSTTNFVNGNYRSTLDEIRNLYKKGAEVKRLRSDIREEAPVQYRSVIDSL